MKTPQELTQSAADHPDSTSIIDEIIEGIDEGSETFDIVMPTGHRMVFARIRNHAEFNKIKRGARAFAQASGHPDPQTATILNESDVETKAAAFILSSLLREPEAAPVLLVKLAYYRPFVFEGLWDKFQENLNYSIRMAYEKAVEEGKVTSSETSSTAIG